MVSICNTMLCQMMDLDVNFLIFFVNLERSHLLENGSQKIFENSSRILKTHIFHFYGSKFILANFFFWMAFFFHLFSAKNFHFAKKGCDENFFFLKKKGCTALYTCNYQIAHDQLRGIAVSRTKKFEVFTLTDDIIPCLQQLSLNKVCNQLRIISMQL